RRHARCQRVDDLVLRLASDRGQDQLHGQDIRDAHGAPPKQAPCRAGHHAAPGLRATRHRDAVQTAIPASQCAVAAAAPRRGLPPRARINIVPPMIDYEAFERAIGLNWYTVDPNLQALMDRLLDPADREWAEDHLVRIGALCGGPIAERAETI